MRSTTKVPGAFFILTKKCRSHLYVLMVSLASFMNSARNARFSLQVLPNQTVSINIWKESLSGFFSNECFVVLFTSNLKFRKYSFIEDAIGIKCWCSLNRISLFMSTLCLFSVAIKSCGLIVS